MPHGRQSLILGIPVSACCSYLGFGLMAGRAAVLSWEEAKAANPCILADHQGTYEYGGMKYELVAHPSGSTFDACSKLVQMVLQQNKECGAPQVPISPQMQRLLLFWGCSDGRRRLITFERAQEHDVL